MHNITENILNVFEGFRMAPTPIDQYESKGKQLLRDKIQSFVANNKTIDFVMLGFPFKSANTRDKVLGKLPDLAEEVTLANFEAFNKSIKSVYSPGINMHIVSDGFIFNDLLNVDDNVVNEYSEISKDLGRIAPMKWYDINDFYSGNSLSNKREKVMEDFGITPETLQKRILFDADVNYLYRGMSIFMAEELAINKYPSKSQRNKAAKILVREMMMRNEAYSTLVREEFAPMVRLSMHSSINDGKKYSFQLIPGETRHSAWHCALVIGDNNQYITMHKKDAIAAGYQLSYKDGRPYNFQIQY